jgi:hypothetical protein
MASPENTTEERHSHYGVMLPNEPPVHQGQVFAAPRQTLSTYLLMRLLSFFDGIIHLAFVTHIYWARIVFGSYPHPLFLVQKRTIQMSSFSTAKAPVSIFFFFSFP